MEELFALLFKDSLFPTVFLCADNNQATSFASTLCSYVAFFEEGKYLPKLLNIAISFELDNQAGCIFRGDNASVSIIKQFWRLFSDNYLQKVLSSFSKRRKHWEKDLQKTSGLIESAQLILDSVTKTPLPQ